MNRWGEAVVAVLVTVFLIAEAAVFVAAGWWARGSWAPEQCFEFIQADITRQLGDVSLDRQDSWLFLLNQCTGDTWRALPYDSEWVPMERPEAPQDLLEDLSEDLSDTLP